MARTFITTESYLAKETRATLTSFSDLANRNSSFFWHSCENAPQFLLLGQAVIDGAGYPFENAENEASALSV